MIKNVVQQQYAHLDYPYLKYLSDNLEQLLFFDIETTGFHRLYDQVISITLLEISEVDSAYFTVQITQYFSEHPSDEYSMLIESEQIFARHAILVAYNGHSFDIPFINAKYRYYNIISLLNKCMCYDLYLISKKILTLPRYNLKAIESALGISREDTLSGKEVAALYHQYAVRPIAEIPRLILQHNIEDVVHLIGLTNVLRHQPDYFDNHFKILTSSIQDQRFYLDVFKISGDFFSFSIYTNLTLPKHYHDNAGLSLILDRAAGHAVNASVIIKESFSAIHHYTLRIPIQRIQIQDVQAVIVHYEPLLLSLSRTDMIIVYNNAYVQENILEISKLLIHALL